MCFKILFFSPQLEAQYGAEVHRHLFRCLFSHVDFSGDGKSSGKDFHQVGNREVFVGSLLLSSIPILFEVNLRQVRPETNFKVMRCIFRHSIYNKSA